MSKNNCRFKRLHFFPSSSSSFTFSSADCLLDCDISGGHAVRVCFEPNVEIIAGALRRGSRRGCERDSIQEMRNKQKLTC